MMEFKRHNDILAIKTEDGRYLGFHARNLEVASLSQELWESHLLSGFKSLTENQNQGPSNESHLVAFTDAERALKAWDEEELLQSEKAKPEFDSLTINVTQICNLHCQYCAAGGDGSYGDPIKRISVEKTLPQLKYFVGKLSAGKKLKINFVGGEPLLYPEGIELIYDYLEEITRARDVSVRYKIVTNGTLLNEKNLSLLQKVKPYLVISLDGPAEINDLRRPTKGGRGATAMVIEGIERLKAIKGSLEHFEVSGVFGPGNLDLIGAYNFYKALGADSFDFTFDHHAHDLASSEAYIEEYQKLLELVYLEGGETALRQITAIDTLFGNLDEQRRIENFCGAGKNFLVIDAKNNLYTCPWESGQAEEMVGHNTSLFPERLQKYQAPLIDKPECQKCWARFLCGGGCMYIHKNSTGFKNKVDEMFCFRQRNLISTTISYYERSRNYKELTYATH